MTYAPPKTILAVLRTIEYEEALGPTDSRRVDTTAARGGDRIYLRFCRKFGLADPDFYPASKRHVLFFGHVGVGKSTELKRYAADVAQSRHLVPVEVDVPSVLDRNNLQYSDALMAMAEALLRKAEELKVAPPAKAMEPIRKWFDDCIVEDVKLRELQGSVETEAKATQSIPFLANFAAKITASLRTNSQHKETLRKTIRETFGALAQAFNTLVAGVEDALTRSREVDVRVLFVLDGTDKLNGDDTARFFVQDANQLLQIQALVVYTAPISMKYEGNLAQDLDCDLVLPMIKLTDPDNQPLPVGWDCLREILLRRADASLFAQDADRERLIEMSGGHPRELLKLLKLACEYAEGDKIDATAVEKAERKLAAEYRYLLQPADYELLARIDRDPSDTGNDDRCAWLLMRLALLAYNDGSWRRPHPVVRLLEGFVRAQAVLAAGKPVF